MKELEQGVSGPNALARSRAFFSISDRWLKVRKGPSGFDYMRVSLACFVLIWHSYQISYGWDAALAFWQRPIAAPLCLILPMFFSLSGFLVYGSLERLNHIGLFLTLRIIRIYPALLVEVFVSAAILGPVVTTLPLREYFASRFFFTYFFNMVGWIHYRLPGVFDENPIEGMVNVSLWTIPFELECYILIVLSVFIGYRSSRLASVAVFVTSTLVVFGLMKLTGESPAPPGGLHGRILVLCFLAGTLIFRLKDVLPFSAPLAVICALLAVLMLRLEASVYLAPIFVAYFTVFLGLQNPQRNIIVTSGDYSYGVYLYAAPIQQAIVYVLGSANSWMINMMLALPITVGFSLLSWHLVEKHFLKLKRYIVRKPVD